MNGKLVGTETSVPATVNTEIPMIGSSVEWAEFFNGSIDELYMFDSELTKEEVFALYATDLYTYEFTCWSGPLVDLSTNAYEIRATDQYGNTTPSENYSEAFIEADDFGGLSLNNLWRLEDPDNIIDSIGTANEGIFSEYPEYTPIVVEGVFGNGIYFTDGKRILIDDPTSQYSFNDSEQYMSHILFEGIVYSDELFGGGWENRTIISKQNSDNDDILWRLAVDKDGGVRCEVNTIGGKVELVSAEYIDEELVGEIIENEQWYRIGCDWNQGTGELKAMIDGEEVATITTDIPLASRKFADSTGYLVLGGLIEDQDSELSLDGYLDNVKIYYAPVVQEDEEASIELDNTSVHTTSSSYLVQGTATSSNDILQIQYRAYNQTQGENENWSNCTCDDEECNSTSEEFSCTITNIPSSTTTYEIRFGHSDPLQFISSINYGRIDILRGEVNHLVSWYSFDQTSELTDSSGNGHSGIPIGSTNSSTSDLTGSTTNVLDGSNFFGILDDSGDFNFNGTNDEFTADIWIKPEGGLPTDSNHYIIQKASPTSSNDYTLWGLKLHVKNDGTYEIIGEVKSANTQGQSYWTIISDGVDESERPINAEITPGEWNHIVFSFSNIDFTMTMRINDNYTDTTSLSRNLKLETSEEPLMIGANYLGNYRFIGEIDDIKIYNTADTRSPQITFTPLANPEKVSNPNQEFEITITDETGVESFQYLFYQFPGSMSEGYVTPIDDLSWVNITTPDEGQWGDKEVVVRFNAPNLADSVWYLYTRSQDSNKLNTILPPDFWYTEVSLTTPSAMPYYYFFIEARDTTPPQIFANAIIPQNTVDTNPGVRGYVKDNTSDTTSNIDSIEYKLEKGETIDDVWVPELPGTWLLVTPLGIESIFDSTVEEFYLEFPNLVPGDYKLEIRAEDDAGNSTQASAGNHIGYFTVYEIDELPETTSLIKQEDFNSHDYHDLLFSDGVWGNGILRLRQEIEFNQSTELFTNNNDFGFQYGSATPKMMDSIDGNFWVILNDGTFMYYNLTTEEYTRYPVPKNGNLKYIYEFEYNGNRYLSLNYEGETSTIIYNINNTPANTSDDTHVDYESKAGFDLHKGFELKGIDTRNGKFAYFASIDTTDEDAADNALIWIDTKGTIMTISDDTYVVWGTDDNLFYMDSLDEYYTEHNNVSIFFDQELNTFIVGSYEYGVFVCNDGGDPEEKSNDSCRHYLTSTGPLGIYPELVAVFHIIKDTHGYYWLGGNLGLSRIDSKNTGNLSDDTVDIVISYEDFFGENIDKLIFIPGEYPVGDEIWYSTRNGYLRAIEYNFTYDDTLDDTNYSYKIQYLGNRIGGDGSLLIRGRNTFYTIVQGQGIEKISLTRTFASTNTIEMLPIPPDGILAINYIDLEEVLGSVTNGSQYTLNELVTYEVSNDSGVTWYPITQGQRVSFPTPDYKLKIKIILTSGSSPIIDLLKVSYIVYADPSENTCDIKINNERPVITSIQPNTNKSFTVNFTPLISDSVSSYTLEYGSSATSFTLGTQTVSSDKTSITVSNIETNKEYFFRIKGSSDCTSSLWSSVLSATNTGSTEQPPVTPEETPSNQPTTKTPSATNLCGNGILDEGEECEYTNSETYMCEDGTYATCSTECKLFTDNCNKDSEKPTTPIIDKIKDNIKDGEEDNQGISAAQIANWAVKLASLSLLVLSVPLIPYYLLRAFIGILYLIGKRNRNKAYGYVYDSVTKEPIKQAIVRIYEGDKLVHTDVTGAYGEFGGNLEEGRYIISVQKPNYSFPSTRIFGSTDSHITNIYTGTLNISQNSEVVTAVPIDYNRTKIFDIFKTVVVNRASVLFQLFKLLIFAGLLLYSVYVYSISSTTLNLIVLIEYAFVLLILLISSLSKNIKYGKITNTYGDPVEGVNIGLFEIEFGRLQAERVTDSKGQYRFITKPGTYKIESLSPNYTLEQKEHITVHDEPSIINKDLKIH